MARRVISFIVLYLLWIPIWYWGSLQIGRLINPQGAEHGLTGLTTVLLIIGYGVPGALGPYLLQRTPGWKKTVLANGRSAPAVIRQIKNTRWGDRHNPFYQFTLEVQPPGEAAFVVNFEQSTDWKGRNWEYRKPGESVMVKYDPQNKRHVVVTETAPPHGPSQHPGAAAHPPSHVHPPDQDHRPDPLRPPDQNQPPSQAPKPAPAAPPTDLAGELERLASLREQGQLTDAEYEAAKHKLLG